VLERLRDADVPAAPVWTFDELMASGHVEARDMLQQGCNSVLGNIRIVPQPVKFSESSRVASMRTPTLGENTDAVLQSELGLEASQIAALRAAKAI
jgi:CoA:oxalate CoA-transferase